MREARTIGSAGQRDQAAVKLQAVYDSIPVGLAFLDGDLRCTDLNDRMAEMLGLSSDALIGRTLAESLPALEERLTPLLLRALGGESLEGVEIIRAGSTPNMPARVLLASFRPLHGDDGGVNALLCSIRDLTEQRRIEAALRESEDHYRHSVEMSPLLPWSSDPDGLSLEVSPRWRDRMGMTYEEAVGTGWQRALHPDDAEGLLDSWGHAMRTGDSLDCEARFRVADGSYRWLRCRASARRDEEGRILQWFGSDEDIHDRKMAEAALRESEDHYRHSVELNPQYPFITDADGMLLEISSRWRDMVGMTHEETLGFGWARAIHPDDIDGIRQNWAEALSTGTRPDHEKRVRLADGSYRWFRGRATPRRDAEGRIIRWYGSTEDIHDRKMTEAALRESEAFARQILDSNPECMKVLDLEGHLLFMSGPGQKQLEVEDFSCLEGKLWEKVWPVDSRKQVRTAIETAKAGGTGRFIGRCPTAKGTVKWWDNLICPLHGGDGRPDRLLAISRDITETQLAREALEKSALRLSAVLESTTDGVIFVDCNWRITYANRRAAEVHRARGVSLGDRLFEVFPDEAGRFEGPFCRAMREQVPVVFEEYLPPREAWLEVHVFPTAEGLSIFFRDVTGRRRAEQERLLAQAKIEHLARYDALTGLPNRLFFQERLEEALQGAGKASLAVHYLDLDQFKTVNDTLGHPAGDALLRQVATRLRRCAGTTDLVARFGGDEFAIVQTALEQPDDAAALARCIVQALGEPFEVDGAQILASTSIGIALAQSDGASVDALMKAADIALYRAKAGGRGAYRFFAPSMAEELQAYHALKLGLRCALARGEFELHYQPLVSLRSGEISGFEALLRWRHPERGLVSPAEFIPVAEETGLIVEIGEWVLREACREAARWPNGIGVSVNLSSIQFRSKGLVESVGQVLAETRLAPGRLELEITESVLLQDNEANLAVLRELRKLGVRIAMDDFGTGYSALSYLRCFPFSKIKIDRSFVGDLPHAESSKAIMRAIAGLGHSLDITTTAEGVENLFQLEAVRAQGCNEAQGYFFSRPVPAAEIPAVFQRIAWMGLIDPSRGTPPGGAIQHAMQDPCCAPSPYLSTKVPQDGCS